MKEYDHIRVNKEDSIALKQLAEERGLTLIDLIHELTVNNNTVNKGAVNNEIRPAVNKTVNKDSVTVTEKQPMLIPPVKKMTMFEWMEENRDSVSPGKFRECYQKYLTQ